MLNENIKNIRKQKGYTQETFAQELNVVRQTVSKWEKGYSVPDAVMLEKMAELFEVSVSELLGETEAEKDEKPDLRQISEQLSILNNQIAKELARKRRNRKIALIVLAVIFSALFLFSFFILFLPSSDTQEVEYCQISDDLEAVIHQSILKENETASWNGECPTESHIVYGTKENGSVVQVYLLENFASYGFENGYFVEVGGHAIPAVYTFTYTDSCIELNSVEYAKDGSDYTPSIKKMFPRKIAKKILQGTTEAEESLMNAQQRQMAREYLSGIGRDNSIADYTNLEYIPLSDLGISVDVSNKLCEMCLGYKTEIGNFEKLEDGVRYVYQTEYDSEKDRITFTKFEYDTKNIVEFIAVDGETGEIIQNAEKPDSVIYKRGKLTSENEFTTVAVYG